MNSVELDGVTKRFRSTVAVDALSLHVPAGSVYGFIGPNGSGKTTTLRVIMRILHPDVGRIRVLGEDATGSSAATDRIGYLPEERSLYRKMQVREVLRFFCELKGVRPAASQIDGWLARFDLANYAALKVETLSKGMSQKVQFIATVLHDPELVILDEPFSGLDPVNMEVLRDAILELKRLGKTIIFSTHDMDVAEKMCDYIFMICKGSKVLDGTLDSIKREYGEDTVRVRIGGVGVSFETLPGVEKVTDFGRFQELRLNSGADPQAILRQLAGQASIEHFELAQPTLRDIFVRIASPAEEDANNA